MAKFSSIPNVLAARYASQGMQELWSPENKIVLERRLWLAVLEAQRELGVAVPDAAIAAYRAVLEHHGWGSVADALANHARHGRWDAMTALVTDEMVDAFAVVARPGELRTSLERHADGLLDRVAPYPSFGSSVWGAL